jgi:hypothetical protein
MFNDYFSDVSVVAEPVVVIHKPTAKLDQRSFYEQIEAAYDFQWNAPLAEIDLVDDYEKADLDFKHWHDFQVATLRVDLPSLIKQEIAW